MLFAAAETTSPGLVDAFTQWLVSAPVFFQMLFLLVVVIPLMVVGAWFLMFVVDRVGGTIELRAARKKNKKGEAPPASENTPPASRIKAHRGRGAKIVHHVTPES